MLHDPVLVPSQRRVQQEADGLKVATVKEPFTGSATLLARNQCETAESCSADASPAAGHLHSHSFEGSVAGFHWHSAL